MSQTMSDAEKDDLIKAYSHKVSSMQKQIDSRIAEANSYKEALKDIKALTNDNKVLSVVNNALKEKIFSPEIGADKFLSLGELKELIDSTLNDRPHLKDAEVLIDTEARRYHCHMVPVNGFWAEDDETMLMMNDRHHVSISIDTSYTSY